MARTYADLRSRIDVLAQSLLTFPRLPGGGYSPKEIDQTKAFVLLSHAEIESFLEEIAVEAVDEAADKWIRQGKQSYILSRLVTHWFGSKKQEFELLSDEIVLGAAKNFKNEISTNHGVKVQNILNIFLQLGFNFDQFDPTVMPSFNLFGEDRGLLAHKSSKARAELNPEDEEKRVKQVLMPEVSKIYQTLQNLKI